MESFKHPPAVKQVQGFIARRDVMSDVDAERVVRNFLATLQVCWTAFPGMK